ncbi:hypothetical protein EVB99_030 [Rhizobium phage RHph_N3_19]|nr:hypothetical protein EVB99_030 [Rhizobium phage RHph_N3_19]
MTFSVGDVIRPNKANEYVSRRYTNQGPYTVIRLHNGPGSIPNGVYIDGGGGGWYLFKRFELVEFQYDPSQQGDTEEDI